MLQVKPCSIAIKRVSKIGVQSPELWYPVSLTRMWMMLPNVKADGVGDLKLQLP